jgi:hypothetical protein
MHRQFMWGLSNGILNLALAGLFWFGMAVVSRGVRWPYNLAWEAPIVSAAALIFAGAVRVRRKAMGFKRSDLKHADSEQRERTRKINRGFRWAIVGEILLIWLSIFLCYACQRPDLVWPGIALAVSLHFLPLARIFRVRPYYALAVSGSAVALAVILTPESVLPPALRLQVLGIGMGATVWITAAYAILNAGQLATEWDHAN